MNNIVILIIGYFLGNLFMYIATSDAFESVHYEKLDETIHKAEKFCADNDTILDTIDISDADSISARCKDKNTEISYKVDWNVSD